MKKLMPALLPLILSILSPALLAADKTRAGLKYAGAEPICSRLDHTTRVTQGGCAEPGQATLQSLMQQQ